MMYETERSGLTRLGHEPIDSDVRAVWRTGAAIASVVLATFVLILGMMKWLEGAGGTRAADHEPKTDLNWMKQNPLQQMRAAEQEMLDSYRWIDREEGIARIPMGRAMEIISENGLPAALQGNRSAAAAPAQESTPLPNQPEAPEGE